MRIGLVDQRTNRNNDIWSVVSDYTLSFSQLSSIYTTGAWKTGRGAYLQQCTRNVTQSTTQTELMEAPRTRLVFVLPMYKFSVLKNEKKKWGAQGKVQHLFICEKIRLYVMVSNVRHLSEWLLCPVLTQREEIQNVQRCCPPSSLLCSTL